MNSSIERLLSLRVKDVMRTDVVVVRQSETMEEAARTLAEANITGAPVVDEAGRCVGMLSGTDFVDHRAGSHPTSQLCDDDGSYSIELLNDQLVSTHMAPVVQSTEPETPLMQAARVVCQEHIHRLVVIDDSKRPVGILSSLDFVAAMVASIEE